MNEYNERYMLELSNRMRKTLYISLKEYVELYPQLYDEYENKFDIPEIWFVTLELERFENFLHYVRYLEKDDNTMDFVEKDDKILEFEKLHDPWLRDICSEIRLNELRMESSLRRKIAYLKKKLKILEKDYQEPVDSLNINNDQHSLELKLPVIHLREGAKIDEISTFFYNLLRDDKITSTKADLKKVIIGLFRDKSGGRLKESTIDTHFNDSKGYSRSKKLK